MSYNGWKNYETWNIAVWLSNDDKLYQLALEESNYNNLVERLCDLGITQTEDGVYFNDLSIDIEEINSLLSEMSENEK